MARKHDAAKPRMRLWGPVNHPAWRRRVDFAPMPGITPDPYVGRCRDCGRYLSASECETGGAGHAPEGFCRYCGGEVDEDEPPF